MALSNKIRDGVHLDNNVYDQPENTIRDSLNGVITSSESGNYKWTNLKGNTLSFSIPLPDKYFSHCMIRNRLIIITLNVDGQIVKFWEILLTGTIGATFLLYATNNDEFAFSYDYPIRRIFGSYENDLIQRIYLTDWHGYPRVVNIGEAGAFFLTEKFTRFTPVIDSVYGKFTLLAQSVGGSVKAGTMFFTWRFYTNDGYFTDWAYLTSPVQVALSGEGSTYNSYQNVQGGRPDGSTGRKIKFRIEDLDLDYNSIQIAAFYSNDLNIAMPGAIIYDGAISGVSMDFTYSGSEVLGTVTIPELIETSSVIEKCKDMVVADKMNVAANITERGDIDVSGLNPDGKQSYIPAQVMTEDYNIVIDTAGYPGKMIASSEDKALFGVHTADYDRTNMILRRGQWYIAEDETVWSNADPATIQSTITIPAGNVFLVPVTSVAVLYISGTFKACIVIKKYLKAGHDPYGDINTEFVFDVVPLEGEYLDYKSPKVAHYLRGYPQGEKIRLGVLFFDKTGRPFLVRHLRNTVIGTGYGDITISKRSILNPIVDQVTATGVAAGGDYYYNQVNAIVKSLVVSDLDITDIADKIGGFMIVRAPIVHQYLAMGVLVPTFINVNDVFSRQFFSGSAMGTNNYDKCYDFYCPEDMFNLKDFVLKEGLELENVYMMKPFAQGEAYTIGNGGANNWSGIGRYEGDNMSFYHKFLLRDNTTDTQNGVSGVSHKIESATKYLVGDDKVPINPMDATKQYQANCNAYNDGENNHRGINGSHSIVMLDIDEVTGGIKGRETIPKLTPRALLCSVKDPNPDPYSGYDDSSVANSLYVTTGHFQEIDTTVLADVLTNGRYVFNNIQVFGGDTFISLFDYKRVYSNEDDSIQLYGQSIIFPVESRMNLAMREGAHVAKERSYDKDYNTHGIRMKVGATLLEEFNYNDGYSSDQIGDHYVPVPFGYKPVNDFDYRMRYSLTKNNGERQDKFRVFPPLDYLDLDANNGGINNIRYRANRVIYWQPDEVGYVPLKERALTQNQLGAPVQLGVGGIFERYDQLIDIVGNSNQFGLVDSPMGYHWYDSKRKIFLFLSSALQFSLDSLLKGVDSFFQTIPLSFALSDNPLKDYGALGGYDPMTKMLYYTFFVSEEMKRTIGINVIINKFIGFFNIYPRGYIVTPGNLFQVKEPLGDYYVHGTGAPGNFFGTQSDAYVTIIVKEEKDESKIFDTFELIGDINFFTKAKYETSTQNIEEVIGEYIGGKWSPLNRNYSYKKRRWLGNFPKVSRERLSDGYLKVTFTISEAYPVELYELITNVRKQY